MRTDVIFHISCYFSYQTIFKISCQSRSVADFRYLLYLQEADKNSYQKGGNGPLYLSFVQEKIGRGCIRALAL